MAGLLGSGALSSDQDGASSSSPPASTTPAPPLPPTASLLTTELVVAGSVSDFTDSVRTSLRQKVATRAGVPLPAVTLSVAAASVRLTFAIALASAPDAAMAQRSLGKEFASPEAASAFLSTPELPISVQA